MGRPHVEWAAVSVIGWDSLYVYGEDFDAKLQSVCIGGGYIYVVSHEEIGGYRWRIEKRRADTGELVDFWVKKPLKGGVLSDCVVVDDKLYVVGNAEVDEFEKEQVLLLLDLDLNLKKVVKCGEALNTISPLATDGRSLYVASLPPEYDRSYFFGEIDEWYLEKRSLKDLRVVRRRKMRFRKSYVIEFGGNEKVTWDVFSDMKIDPATGYIWIAGTESFFKLPSAVVEVYSRRMRRLISLRPGEVAGVDSIGFDGEGNVYVAGDEGVAVYSSYGKKLAEGNIGYRIAGVFRIEDKVYAVTRGSRLLTLGRGLEVAEVVNLWPEIVNHPEVAKYVSKDEDGRVIFGSATDGRYIYGVGVVKAKDLLYAQLVFAISP
jgi:hypothetical protein